MKWFWITFCLIVCLMISISIGILIFTYQSYKLPFHLDNQHSSILFSNIEESKKYELKFLYKYPKTNYIVLHFEFHERKRLFWGQQSTIYKNKIFLIDENKKKRVYSVEYDHYKNNTRNLFYSYNQFSEPVFIRMGYDVVFLIRMKHSSGTTLAYFPPTSSFFSNANNQSEFQYSIRPNGELIDIIGHPYFFPLFGTDEYIVNDDLSNGINLLKLNKDSPEWVTGWKNTVLKPFIFKVSEEVYLTSSKQSKSPNFYFLFKDQIKNITPLNFGDAASTKYFTIKSISVGRTDHQAMILVKQSDTDYSVYEIQTPTGVENQSYLHKVYEYSSNSPFTVMNRNQVILISESNSDFTVRRNSRETYPNDREVIPATEKISFVARDQNEDGKAVFGSELHPLEIPETISYISVHPYDDTHLLLYGNNAVWKMRWDSSELEKIFPELN